MKLIKGEKRQLLVHKVDINYPDTHLDLRNPENTLRIDIKWDGCVNIDLLHNEITFDSSLKDQNEERDYIHICNLQKFIDQLQEAYNRAKEIGFEVDK